MPTPDVRARARPPALSTCSRHPKYTARALSTVALSTVAHHGGAPWRWRDSAFHEVAPARLAGREEAAGDGLLARVELDRIGAVGMEVAQERVLPAREGEERHPRGHAGGYA